MKADEARQLSQAKANEIKVTGSETQAITTPEMVDMVWDEVSLHIRARAVAGKQTGWLEPFVNIPGKLHLGAQEDEVMPLVVSQLEENGYSNIEWDRRDDRVVLRFAW